MTTSIVEIGRRLSARLGIERFARKSYNLLNRVGLLDHQPSAPADEVVDAVLKWLPKRDVTEANRFAWGHLMDPHAPYIPPERYRNIVPNCPDSLSETWKLNEQFRTQMGELSPEQTEKIRGLYDATVQFVDAELSRLVSTLKRRGIWDDTLLVVTADHGEMFNDRPIPDDFPFEHPNYLCDYVTRVPTIVSGGAIPAETVEEVASGMDIAPTFAALVDADCPDEWRGEALTTGLIARDAVYSVTGRGTRQDNTEGHQIRSDTLHASVRTSKHTVLWWSNDAYGPEAYDREGAHMDPTVHESPHKEIEDEVLQSHVETLSDRFGGVPYGDSETEEKMDAETKNRLRELGYLE